MPCPEIDGSFSAEEVDGQSNEHGLERGLKICVGTASRVLVCVVQLRPSAIDGDSRSCERESGSIPAACKIVGMAGAAVNRMDSCGIIRLNAWVRWLRSECSDGT